MINKHWIAARILGCVIAVSIFSCSDLFDANEATVSYRSPRFIQNDRILFIKRTEWHKRGGITDSHTESVELVEAIKVMDRDGSNEVLITEFSDEDFTSSSKLIGHMLPVLNGERIAYQLAGNEYYTLITGDGSYISQVNVTGIVEWSPDGQYVLTAQESDSSYSVKDLSGNVIASIQGRCPSWDHNAAILMNRVDSDSLLLIDPLLNEVTLLPYLCSNPAWAGNGTSFIGTTDNAILKVNLDDSTSSQVPYDGYRGTLYPSFDASIFLIGWSGIYVLDGTGEVAIREGHKNWMTIGF